MIVANREQLYTDCIINKQSTWKLAEKYNCSRTTIYKLLYEYSIKHNKTYIQQYPKISILLLKEKELKQLGIKI